MTTLTAPRPAASRTSSPAPPRPLSPLGGDIVDRSSVTFLWASVPGASGYVLEVSPDRQFARGTATFDAGPSTELTLIDALPHTTAPLFWRVRAKVAGGATRWSPYGRFHLGTDDAVDAYRAKREVERLEARRARLRREAEEQAARDLVPDHEREDMTPEDFEVAGIGITMLASFALLILLLVILT